MTAEKCPFKSDMIHVAKALNECQGWTLKQRLDALEGVKRGVCGKHCATVCKHWVNDLTEGQRWLLK